MAAQALDPGYAWVGRVSEAPPDGFSRMAAQTLFPGQTLSQRKPTAPDKAQNKELDNAK